jgi:glucosylceramidase
MKTILRSFHLRTFLLFAILFISASCTKLAYNNQNSISKKSLSGDNSTFTSLAASTDVNYWITKGDQSVLLQKQNTNLVFGTAKNRYPNITVDTTQTFQSIDGFGYTLTGASAYLIII